MSDLLTKEEAIGRIKLWVMIMEWSVLNLREDDSCFYGAKLSMPLVQSIARNREQGRRKCPCSEYIHFQRAMITEYIIRYKLYSWCFPQSSIGHILAMLRDRQSMKAEREADVKKNGYPVYITSAGWLGYSDDRIRQVCILNNSSFQYQINTQVLSLIISAKRPISHYGRVNVHLLLFLKPISVRWL